MNEAIFDTSMGHLLIKEDGGFIIELSLTNAELKSNDNPIIQKAIKEIDEYFMNQRKSFTIPIKLFGTPFQKKVWRALLAIPYGATVSYFDVAQAIHNEKAVRAVGQAIHVNPLMIIVPCHRVINKNGNLGGFAPGIAYKCFLLDLEKKNLF